MRVVGLIATLIACATAEKIFLSSYWSAEDTKRISESFQVWRSLFERAKGSSVWFKQKFSEIYEKFDAVVMTWRNYMLTLHLILLFFKNVNSILYLFIFCRMFSRRRMISLLSITPLADWDCSPRRSMMSRPRFVLVFTHSLDNFVSFANERTLLIQRVCGLAQKVNEKDADALFHAASIAGDLPVRFAHYF